MMTTRSDAGSWERVRGIQAILWATLALNLIVAVAKFGYGTLTGSVSMRADGIASFFDTASNLVGIVGMRLAARPADHDHPYGHAKFETYASAVIGVMLLLAAYNVTTDAIAAFSQGGSGLEVNAGSFVVMVATLGINVGVSVLERSRGRALRSEILLADSMHTMSDALVSVSVIVSLALSAAGIRLADAVCSLVVAVAILHSAWEVFDKANQTLSDEARIPAEQIAEVVMGIDGVRSCHRIRTRGTEGEVYLDLHVLVDPTLTILEAHALGDVVERLVKERFSQVVDVTLHLEPDVPLQRTLDGASEGIDGV